MIKMKEFIESCKICDKKLCDEYIGKHIKIHSYSLQRYYDDFYKKPGEGICLECGEETNFNKYTKRNNNLYIGYVEYCPKCGAGLTYKKCVARLGEIEGKEVWDRYCERQAKVNTFEYKQEKYGWTREQFDEYNKSRAVTLENCISRHGPEEGTKIFEDYCEKQKTAGISLEYFIEKLGQEEGTKKYYEVNKMKGLTLETFIRKYGEDEGRIKFDEHMANRKNRKIGYSKISQELFHAIYNKLEDKDDTIFFAELNYECFFYNEEAKRSYYFDFLDFTHKKIIEFNGISFHAKSENDENFINPFDKNLKSKDVYLKEKEKLDYIKSNGFEVMIVWEDEYNKDKENVINECIKFLRG